MVKKAVLIGINYKGQEGELRGCINDIRNIRDILVNNCEYLPGNIRVLTEEDVVKPTRSNIERQIAWLTLNVKAGDTLFFYYSGHGAHVRDTSGDESDGKDEVIIPLDYRQRGIITDDWLYRNMVTKVPLGAKLWCFTDCCHSGTMIDLKYNFQSLCKYKKGEIKLGMPYISDEWTDSFTFSLEPSKGITGTCCLFSGCQDIQYSADAFIKNTFQGAFTYCLIEIIKNNLVLREDGRMMFNVGTLKLYNLLKEINCRLQINGFTEQSSQLSISKNELLDMTLDL